MALEFDSCMFSIPMDNNYGSGTARSIVWAGSGIYENIYLSQTVPVQRVAGRSVGLASKFL